MFKTWVVYKSMTRLEYECVFINIYIMVVRRSRDLIHILMRKCNMQTEWDKLH